MRKLSQNKEKKNKPDTPLVLVQTHPERKKNETINDTKQLMQNKVKKKNKIVPINGAETKKNEQQTIDVKIAKWGEK